MHIDHIVLSSIPCQPKSTGIAYRPTYCGLAIDKVRNVMKKKTKVKYEFKVIYV